ncbi:MAG: translational GTPase TypA [Clostridia bacterium]|nr:translational GTPase TypA [Candidatus Pelethousia sp.]NCB30025.1 translational GTPase TypA [Clostridia bacterium]
MTNETIRNIAIIAHVDHGKTTMVDQLLRQSGVFRANEQVQERVMDSGDLERERGITILSKNTAVNYKNCRINIVDTPGHADFGGEVERILQMVDGVLLLVDAFEGCMPQTRFVLGKALALGKVPVVVVNKVDRPGARPLEVVDETLELFMDLGATAEQLDFPVVYASARDGYSGLDPDHLGTDMQPLFDIILSAVPAPEGDPDGPLQILFSTIDYDDYVGRIGVGRIMRGKATRNEYVTLCGGMKEARREVKLSRLYRFEGLKRVEIEEASAGEIVAVAGVTGLSIGETACDSEHIEPLPFVHIDEPTVSMMFCVNDSPFAGKEGKYVTSRNLRERLLKEVETNVSMRVEETDSTDLFKVSGRGELHLSILIEQMRRQDYEFAVSRPHVIMKTDERGKLLEPIEELTVDVPQEYVGVVMEKLGQRKAELINMLAQNDGSITRLIFTIPARSLLGYRSEFLTDTRGNGVMSHIYHGYDSYKGEIEERTHGSLICHETGETTGYGLFNTQERGRLFVGPGIPVYEGQVVGECSRNEDIVVNVCKKKHVTNMRAAGSDEALRLTPPALMSLEQCIEFIADDELVEVTPKTIRLRKKLLTKDARVKQSNRNS